MTLDIEDLKKRAIQYDNIHGSLHIGICTMEGEINKLREENERLKTRCGEMKEDIEWLRCLERAGIDNSEAYNYACELWNETHKEEE